MLEFLVNCIFLDINGFTMAHLRTTIKAKDYDSCLESVKEFAIKQYITGKIEKSWIYDPRLKVFINVKYPGDDYMTAHSVEYITLTMTDLIGMIAPETQA